MIKQYSRLALCCAAIVFGASLSSCGGSSSKASPDSLVQILGIDTEDGLIQVGADEVPMVSAGEPSTIDIQGLDLRLGLQVALGGAACLTHDLAKFDNLEDDSPIEQISADCPAQGVGTVNLTVADAGQQIYQTPVQVIADSVQAARAVHLESLRPQYTAPHPLSLAQPRIQALVVTAAPGSVAGTITADAPNINTTTGGLSYAAPLRNFKVRGAVLELLDADNLSAKPLQTSATDANGNYSFSNVPVGKNVIVRVSAQLAMTRAAGVATGPQYNLMVRDNTGPGTVKPLYNLSSPATLTVAAGNVMSLNAALGFDSSGKVTGPRQSAPFSILDVMYTAVVNIQAANANITLPDFNVYWSPNNTPAKAGNNIDLKMKGSIGTSHFSENGKYPGVFILGQADVDTDEFDQGVVGHEFGHYLQYAASYSDSPGDSHSSDQFKDASLAYGEGFGTAIGGLLSGSKFYTDSSGESQGGGSSTDISKPVASGKANGFYAEDTVSYLLYTMGTQYRFTPFWNALTSMASGYQSATLFNFLNRYLSQNPGSADAVKALATAQNIRTTDILGALPATAVTDPAINSTASGGAADLEILYLTLNPVVASGSDDVNVTTNPPAFCFNNKLRGANESNGLGMRRRFVFTASQSGWFGLNLRDASGTRFVDGKVFANIRDSKGAKISNYGWNDDLGKIKVVEGTIYSVSVSPDLDTVAGNQCGNTLSLWRIGA
ncbi:MAG: hypothetical protein ACOYNZ_03720 [Rhodoferax sp.]